MEVRAVRPEDSRSGSTGLDAYARVKRYGAVTVLDRLNLTLRTGEILAVVFENRIIKNKGINKHIWD